MRHARMIAVIALITLALDLGLAQIAKRILPSWPALMPASNPRQYSPTVHHALRPMMQVHSRVGAAVYPFNTNSLGMVDATARRVEPRAAGCRVLLIGDSFTEGFGVGWEKSFAGTLAARWREQGVDLLNAAVVSYSPSIYYRRIRQLIEEAGLRFDSVVVFIDMSDAHDEWRSYDLDASENVIAIGKVSQIPPMRDPRWRDRVAFWLQDNSMIAHLVKDLYGALTRKKRPPAGPQPPPVPHRTPAAAALGEVEVPPAIKPPPPQPAEFDGMVNVGNARWTVDPALWAEYGRDGTRVAAERMDRLLLLLRARGVALTVAVYPWPDQIYANDRDSAQVAFWREWARRRDVGFIDLFPPFFRDEDRLATIRRYYLKGDFHWNQAGHALVADAVARAYAPRRFCR
jgi:lysophospholipase L1-like esterase